jgi:hypothetical protein
MITGILGVLVAASVLLPGFYYCFLDRPNTRPKTVSPRPPPRPPQPIDTTKMRGAVKR